MSSPLSRADTASALTLDCEATTGTSWSEGVTCPALQASKATLTLAVPVPAVSGARTGPSRLQYQQRRVS